MVILAWTIFNQGRNDIQKPKCNSLLGATKKISTLIAVPYGEAKPVNSQYFFCIFCVPKEFCL